MLSQTTSQLAGHKALVMSAALSFLVAVWVFAEQSPEVVLENETLRAVVSPAKGGSLTSLTLRAGESQLLGAPSMVDTVWLPGRVGVSLEGMVYEVREQAGGVVSIAGKPTPNPGKMPLPKQFGALEIVKHYRLDAGSTSLVIDYELRNTGDGPLEVCLGTAVGLAVPGDKLQMSLPTRAGSVTYPLSPGAQLPLTAGNRRRAQMYDLSEVWAGVVSERKTGVVVGFDAEHVSFLQASAGRKETHAARTLAQLKPGATTRTHIWIMPVQGLERVSSAQGQLAAEVTVSPPAADGSPPLEPLEFRDRLAKGADSAFDKTGAKDLLEGGGDLEEDADFDTFVEEDVEGGPSRYRGKPIQVRLRLLSAKTRAANVTWSVRKNLTDEWGELGADTTSLTAGKPAILTKKISPKEKGTYVARAKITEGGTVIACFEQPIVVGAPTGFYLQPSVPRKGAVYAAWRQHLWVPSTEVERFPLPLGTPLAGGPIRMLFATPHWASRGLVEIQHRLDVDVDPVIGGAFYDRSNDTRASPAEIVALREFLNRPHEVIVLAVGSGDYFPIDILDEILRQVAKEGAGLVLLSWENHLGELDPLLEALKKSPAEDPGLADRLFPGVKAGRLGKGRIAMGGAAKMYVRPDWYGESEAEVQKLLRTIVWAARGAPPVRVALEDSSKALDNQALAAEPLAVQVENLSKKPLAGKLRLTPRRDLLRAYPFYDTGNAFGYRPQVGWEQAALPIEQPIRIEPGRRTTLGLNVPLLPACEYDFDIQVLDSEDRVIHWQSIPLTLKSTPELTEVTLSSAREGVTKTFALPDPTGRPWFRADAVDTLKAVCKVKDPGAAVAARLQGFDPWGRIPFDQRVELFHAGDTATASFEQPLFSCVHLICVLRFSLLDAEGRELLERRILCFINSAPDFRPAFELRGYAEVRVANDVTGYDARVGGEQPLSLAWHNVRKADYGGFIPMAQKILEPGYKPLDLPDTNDLAATADIGKKEDADEDIVGEFEEKKIDPKAGWIRVPCFNNPEDRKGILDSVRGAYTSLSTCYPYAGFAVDEFVYAKEYDPSNTTSFFRRPFIPQRDTNICRCEHCLASFRKYAESLFKEDLERLNQEWGTKFKSWKEVDPPLTVTDNETPPPTERWRHILAHRDFISQQVANLMNEINMTIKKIHPECLTGFSGLWKTGFTMGVDIYRLSKNMIYNMLYGDIDIWTDFGESQAVRWTGYGRKYRLLQGSVDPYRAINAGQTGLGYYGKWRNPMHRGDFTFHPEPLTFFNEVRKLKESGIDRLVVRRRYRDPVALYYSPRDVYLAQLEDWLEDPAGFVARMRNCGRSCGEFCHSEYGTYRALLHGHRLQPFWTAYAHLEEGHFGKKFGTPKLLLLPYAQCLSERQIETIRAFVRDGGVLVGDIHTGFRNEHGRLFEEWPLAEVFGLKRVGGEYRMRRRVDMKTAAEAVQFGKELGEPFAMAFPAVGPGDVAPTTAAPLASYLLDGRKQPAFLVNTYGKGKALYLNFIPAGYVAVELEGEGEERSVKTLDGKAGEYFQRCFGKILELAGIERPMEFVGPALGSTRFGEGDLTYIGVVSSRSLEALRRSYTVRIPEKKHAYIVRGREYLGFTDTPTFRLDEATRRAGDLISLLPYKVEGLSVESPASVRAGQVLRAAVRVLPEQAQTRRHVVTVRVIAPEGKDLRWYRHSVETKDGVARIAIGLAANDPPGKWTLRLTDAASGTQRDVSFEVLKP